MDTGAGAKGAGPPGVGEPAPWFKCPTDARQGFAFDTVAGRYIVLCLFGSAADPAWARVLQRIALDRRRFDDVNASFFGVSVDPEDERQRRVAASLPGIRYFWDFDRAVSALYGAQRPDGSYRGISYVLDPALRVLAALPLGAGGDAHASALFAFLDGLPPVGPEYRAAPQAPVLVVPGVFEPRLCRELVEYYEATGGADSGFMEDVNGRTVAVVRHDHKRRRDCIIADEGLFGACMQRLRARLVPEIHRAFQFRTTRVERFIVACYDAAEGGHFRPHRDNTTRGTAHRRFAVSLFLNSGEYQGGFLRFPEFGRGLYTAPPGGAVVFSCSLLHEATPVTRGRRYMFLPFLYDEAGRRIRDENLRYLGAGEGGVSGDGTATEIAPPPQ